MERKVLFEDIEMNKVPGAEKLEKTFKKLYKEAIADHLNWEEMVEGLDRIRVWFKDSPVLSISEERMCCMKGEILLNVPPATVFEMIVNPESRVKWDRLFREIQVVETIDGNTNILHMKSSSPHDDGESAGMEYLILQYIHSVKSTEVAYAISERSTKHSKVPTGGTTRGQVFPSGFVITPDPQNKKKSRVVYIMRQLGNEALGAKLVTQWEVFMESLVNLRDILSK